MWPEHSWGQPDTSFHIKAHNKDIGDIIINTCCMLQPTIHIISVININTPNDYIQNSIHSPLLGQ